MSMGPARDRRPMSPSGFTLIEVVVTLVIIGIMAAVAVPAILDDPERSDLDASVQRLETLLRLARDSAVIGAVPVRVSIDSATAAVWVSTAAGTGFAAGSGFATGPTSGATPSLELPSGVRMQATSARAEFVFQPGGGAFSDSLYLSSATEGRLVTLDPLTGHVVVLR